MMTWEPRAPAARPTVCAAVDRWLSKQAARGLRARPRLSEEPTGSGGERRGRAWRAVARDCEPDTCAASGKATCASRRHAPPARRPPTLFGDRVAGRAWAGAPEAARVSNTQRCQPDLRLIRRAPARGASARTPAHTQHAVASGAEGASRRAATSAAAAQSLPATELSATYTPGRSPRPAV